MKNIRVFLYQNFQLLEVKFSIYFNRRVFVIICRNSRTTGTNPHQSVPSVTSQHVASSQTGTSVEMYRII